MRPCRVLLVGEGDFSYALALARRLRGAVQLTATSYDSREEVLSRYGPVGVADTLKELCARGVRVLHSVDATQLGSHALQYGWASLSSGKCEECQAVSTVMGEEDEGKSRGQDGGADAGADEGIGIGIGNDSAMGPGFDVVQWQFPHTGIKGKIHLSRALLHNFFCSARDVLAPPEAANLSATGTGTSTSTGSRAGAHDDADRAELVGRRKRWQDILHNVRCSPPGADVAVADTSGDASISWTSASPSPSTSTLNGSDVSTHGDRNDSGWLWHAGSHGGIASLPRVIVTLAPGQGGSPADGPHLRCWGDSWQVQEQAARTRLVLAAVAPFDEQGWHAAGYRDRGYKSRGTKGFTTAGAQTHVLVPERQGVSALFPRSHTHDFSFWCGTASDARKDSSRGDVDVDGDNGSGGSGRPTFTEAALRLSATQSVGADISIDLELLDEYVHPKTGRTSRCYRITYTPHSGTDIAFSTAMAARLNARVKADLEAQFDVELRDSNRDGITGPE